MTDPLAFLAGGGEAARMIRARDWSAHPMGPPQGWSESFKTALSLVLNSPESMILAWGPELHFFFNDTYFRLLGPRLPWAMGERFDKVWADGWAQAKPIIDAALEGRSTRYVDLPWKLGTDRGAADTWWTFSYSRVLDGQGAVAGLFILTNETTEHVLGSRALRESEERLRLVVEGAKDHAILTTDAGGVITSWSAGAALAFGWTTEEAVGQPTALIFLPADRAAGLDRRELDTAAREGRANDERWHQTKSGAPVFMSGSVRPLGDGRGFIKIARDETERQRAAHRLALEAERQRRSLQQMPGFVCILNGPEHVYEYVNDAYVAIAGQRDFIGRPLREVFPELRGQGYLEAIDEVFRTGRPFSAMAAPIHLAGEAAPRFIDILYQAIRDDAGGIIGIFAGGHDVTERVRAEQALAEANATLEDRVAEALRERAAAEEALRQSQKMEAVGQLTGGIAHDFNNLLTGISGSLEVVGNRLAQGRRDGLDRYIAAAQDAAGRAAALTHRLLAFSRRQTLDPRPTDINRLVAGMEDLVRRTAGPGITLSVTTSSGLWPVLVDPPQLENALLNLCINARDAMPGGGRLVLATTNRRLDGAAARALGLPPGDYVALGVTDTGTGMAPDVIAKAFDPFFTTKPIGQGTGLGLSMIYGFARQSGGQARIRSTPGQGTTVSLLLPRHAGPADAAGTTPAAGAAPRAGTGETVLVVDDEPVVRMLVAEVLQELGYAALEAADGAAGLALLQSPARVDLLVSDVGLPGGMNGRQLADAARLLRPGLRVLFITGYAEAAVLGEGQLEPGMHVMTKPFAMQALASRIRELVG
ncbi:hybrid sensor histidine kinase/response regulator [Roseomonas haemaphysalidis]|uniref:histidine kinase n=1 Tax=Roseomonas haemaphysalidis TaxID=2768162 RepID=A0ABS3KQV1_9PROT|nr:PAS domain-containing protein [Roseomonas haemaphysalidis]MBO1079819.1 PAS domain-containing protein [Roseomonas haemaphysalidis]